MTGLDIFALLVLCVLVLTGLGALVLLARWPGKIARSRSHPQADAINVAGWLGIISVGIIWPFAFIWAHTKSPYLSTGGTVPTAGSEGDQT